MKTFIILSSGGSFIQLSRTNCAICFDSIMRNNSVKYYFNLDPWFRRRCCLNIFLMPFCSAKQNHQCNFGKGHFWEQFCEIIIYFDQLFRRRCHLKIFLIYSSGGPFVKQAEIFVQLGKGHNEEQFCEIAMNSDQM